MSQASRTRYGEQGVTENMYRYGMPIRRTTRRSEDEVIEYVGNDISKHGLSDYEAQLLTFLVGKDNAYYINRATQAATRAKRAGDDDTARAIYDLIFRPDLPSWVFYYHLGK